MSIIIQITKFFYCLRLWHCKDIVSLAPHVLSPGLLRASQERVMEIQNPLPVCPCKQLLQVRGHHQRFVRLYIPRRPHYEVTDVQLAVKVEVPKEGCGEDASRSADVATADAHCAQVWFLVVGVGAMAFVCGVVGVVFLVGGVSWGRASHCV